MSNPSDRRNSRRARRICRETHQQMDHLGRLIMICHCGCRGIIYPKSSSWRADHIRRWSEGGRDTPDNLLPILLACDAGTDGKAAQDTKTVAHGKRMADRHYGYRPRKGPPMAGSKASIWKKKLSGLVVRR